MFNSNQTILEYMDTSLANATKCLDILIVSGADTKFYMETLVKMTDARNKFYERYFCDNP